MFIPKFRQKKPLYTSGDEFNVDRTGDVYIGYYVPTTTGEYYSGLEINSNSDKLSKIYSRQENIDYAPYEHYDGLVNNKQVFELKTTNLLPSYKPTGNGNAKVLKRFFAKNIIKNTIQEISSDTYRAIQGKSTQYHWPSYIVVFIEWSLDPQVGDIKKGSYIIEGAESKNRKAVLAADKIMPGIAQLLSDYRELI